MADIEWASIPQELIEQIARGNCVLLLGPDAGFEDGLDTLAQALAEECDYPPDKTDRSLLAVARYYQTMTNEHQLIVRLREWLERDGNRPAPLHHAVAGLPVNRIVDFDYDSRMEAALREARCPCTLVVHDHELPYADRSKVLLAKPYGTADQPDSLVLTEDGHDLFARNHPLLTDQLRVWAATQVLPWVGVDPTDFYWRRLHEVMTVDISPRHLREYALVERGGPVEAWAERGVTPLAVPDFTAWLAELTQAVAEIPPVATDVLIRPGPLLGRRPYKFLDFYTAEDADLGRYEQAIADFEMYLKLRPDAEDRAEVEQRIRELKGE
jgi:hypothetical protein